METKHTYTHTQRTVQILTACNYQHLPIVCYPGSILQWHERVPHMALSKKVHTLCARARAHTHPPAQTALIRAKKASNGPHAVPLKTKVIEKAYRIDAVGTL